MLSGVTILVGAIFICEAIHASAPWDLTCATMAGDGPIDAVFQAIERITGVNVVLQDYRLRSVTIGEDAQGEANVEVEHEGRTLTGRAVSTDVIEASAMAFLQVINRVLRTKGLGRIRPTETPES